MLLFFHVSDEPQLERLQTGVFYADDTPKSSLEPIAHAALARRRRSARIAVDGVNGTRDSSGAWHQHHGRGPDASS